MIIVKKIENEIKELIPLINADYHHSYEPLFSKEDNRFKEFKIKSLNDSIKNPDKEIYCAEENKKIKGFVSLKTLKWDSNIFEVQMGAIDDLYVKGDKNFQETEKKLLNHVIKRAKKLGIKHLSAKADTRHIEKIHLLEDSGFRVMDTLLFFCFNRGSSSKYNTGDHDYPTVKISPFRVKDKNKLIAASKKIFSKYIGRFQADKSFSPKRASKFYIEWVKNGCNGYQDFVFVAKGDKNEITGFSMWKEEKSLRIETGKKIVLLDLVGVDPEYKNRQIASTLVKHGIATLTEFDFFIIPIHVDNVAMQRAAINAGARVISSRYTLHLTI